MMYSEDRLFPVVKLPNFFPAAFRLPELERSIFCFDLFTNNIIIL